MSAQYRIKKEWKCVTTETSYHYEWQWMIQKKSWWTLGWIDWQWCQDEADAHGDLNEFKHPQSKQKPIEYFY